MQTRKLNQREEKSSSKKTDKNTQCCATAQTRPASSSEEANRTSQFGRAAGWGEVGRTPGAIGRRGSPHVARCAALWRRPCRRPWATSAPAPGPASWGHWPPNHGRFEGATRKKKHPQTSQNAQPRVKARRRTHPPRTSARQSPSEGGATASGDHCGRALEVTLWPRRKRSRQLELSAVWARCPVGLPGSAALPPVTMPTGIGGTLTRDRGSQSTDGQDEATGSCPKGTRPHTAKSASGASALANNAPSSECSPGMSEVMRAMTQNADWVADADRRHPKDPWGPPSLSELYQMHPPSRKKAKPGAEGNRRIYLATSRKAPSI